MFSRDEFAKDLYEVSSPSKFLRKWEDLSEPLKEKWRAQADRERAKLPAEERWEWL